MSLESTKGTERSQVLPAPSCTNTEWVAGFIDSCCGGHASIRSVDGGQGSDETSITSGYKLVYENSSEVE
jgi:hypothetical protein